MASDISEAGKPPEDSRKKQEVLKAIDFSLKMALVEACRFCGKTRKFIRKFGVSDTLRHFSSSPDKPPLMF